MPLQQRQILPLITPLLGLPKTWSQTLPLSSLLASSTLSSSSSSLSSSTSTVSSSTPSSTTSSTSSTPSITVAPSTSVYVTGGGTVTVVVGPTNSPKPIVPQANSFLQNKAAEGVVYALVGISVLVLIFVIGTFAIRRRNRRRLVEQAISFDPGVIDAERGSTEKASIRRSESDSFAHQYNHRLYRPPNIIAPRYPMA